MLGNNRYQLEVPESALKSSTPNDYRLKSQKKGFKRFYSNHIEKLLESLTAAEEKRDNALKDSMRNIFNKFDKEYGDFRLFGCLTVSYFILRLYSAFFYRTSFMMDHLKKCLHPFTAPIFLEVCKLFAVLF